MGTNVVFSIKSSFVKNPCANLNLRNDDTSFVLKKIAELFNISDIDIFVACNSRKEWVACINIPTLGGSLLEANNLSLSFALGPNPRFCLNGEFKFNIDVFRLSQMALSLRVGVATEIAMCGRIQLRKLNLFGALALSPSATTVITPHMYSLAVSDITLQEVVESIAGIDIIGDTCLNEIGIQGIKMPLEKITKTPQEIENNLADLGNSLREMVEGVGGSGNDFVYTLQDDNRISIMDKAYMRHYALIPEGDAYIPQVEAQFMLATKKLHLGEYSVSQGAFICANISIFGVQVIAYLNIMGFDTGINIGVRACVILSPIIKVGILEITGTGRSIENSSLRHPAIITPLINLSRKEKGAICYFSAGKKQGINLYLDAHIKLLNIINIDANIQISKGMLRVDTSGCLLSVFKYVLSIKCTYSDFDKASFSALLAIDTSQLKGQFKRIQRKIEDAKMLISSNKDEFEKKFELAKLEIDRLHHQIASFNRQIAKKKHKSSGHDFFKKITYAVQILGLEMAKEAVVCTIAIAQAALKMAKTVADAPFTATYIALDMVNIILEGAMELFYIERFLITATVGKESGFLFDIDFVLFGKHLNVEHRVASLSGVQGQQILNELDKKMFKISGLDSKEMPPVTPSSEYLNELDFNTANLAESLEAGGISVDSTYQIIQNTEALYAKHIDSEMDFVEKEELKASFIQNSHTLKEYTQLSENMNKRVLQILQMLDISGGVQELQELLEKIDGLEELLEEKENLLSMVQNIEKQNVSLKEILDDTAKTIERSRGVIKKDYDKRGDADWNRFAKEMEAMLIKEADKSIGNHYIVPGYERSIIQSIRDYSEFVRKSEIKIPQGYTSRMEN